MIKSHLLSLLGNRGLSAEELIEDLDINKGIIRDLCDGSARKVDFDVLEALCEYLKCDVGQLLSHDG